ncbi:integrase core domain-containing protein [Botrimarina colliarenosi]|uniref:integrase core domain-containing protein n=1 Tax=Botrimarina colliarenosi TaxID=2528001 RepID=UPI0018D2EFA3|nr:integrase core domain-containing protein [Botrimarina colliarenosi]
MPPINTAIFPAGVGTPRPFRGICRGRSRSKSNVGACDRPTSPRPPDQKAFIERWIGSIKGECRHRFIAFGLGHLDYVVEEYVGFYNELRSHSKKGDKPLLSGPRSMLLRTAARRSSVEIGSAACSRTTSG